MGTSTLTQKGQITVPKALRDAFGWSQETALTFVKRDEGVMIVEVDSLPELVLERMQETQWNGPTADELMNETRSEV